MRNDSLWLVLGLLGQGIFSARFIVQWWASEKSQKSVIPLAFWYLSLLGGMTLLIYSIYKKDPVFILGQAMGLFIYLRNLYFVRRKHSPNSLEV